ncbi:MAG: DUF4231 domain-containing protein [Acidobacteriia bacterium]|nr:DUF4231 domain-containing protein [Terriglobia bacterium]
MSADGATDLPEYIDRMLGWYDKTARTCRWRFLWIKWVQITAGACVPIAPWVMGDSKLLVTALGCIVTALEAVQQTLQYQQRWLSFRSTYSRLQREITLYSNSAGVYRANPDAHALFTERSISILEYEQSGWTSLKSDKKGN